MNLHSLQSTGRTRPDTAAFHERAVLRVVAAMRDRLDEELSLDQMAEVAIMSPFHFNRTFHHVTGMPPRRFLSALRLDRARRLLLTTEERVTDVCFDVGYNSLGTFTRRFTEMLGISPRALRGCATSSAASVVQSLPEARPPLLAEGGEVSGTVVVPDDFRGLVFVGLFGAALPQGAPVACRIMAGSGPFSLDAPAGQWHLYALGIRQPAAPLKLLLFDDALRASGGVVDLPAVAERDPVCLALRPPSELDPPILVALPVLLARRQLRMRRSTYVESAEAVV
jgi:AraC-like DNA-binding protein